MRKSIGDTFEDHFTYVEATGCLEWDKSRMPLGYGKLYYKGQYVYTHRHMYEKYVGEIPDGLVIRHLCDNPPCANTKHLALGTSKENAADRRVGGRWSLQGLEDVQVRELRELRSSGATLQSLATKFEVSITAVLYAAIGRTYSHVC